MLDNLRLRYHKDLKPITIKPTPQEGAGGFKPKGLWYSIGTAWEEWCRAEDYGCKPHVHKLELNMSRMLQLNTEKAILQFTQMFRHPSEPFTGSCMRLDWHSVTEEWSGIEITPYFWSLRLNPATSWYYAWDVASGCIWKPDALLSSTPMADPWLGLSFDDCTVVEVGG